MDEQTRQLADAREREAATREILRVISRSPGDYEPVFQTILENAIRLCGAPFGTLLLVRGEIMEVVADTGLGSELTDFFRANPHRLDNPSSLLAGAVRERVPQQRTDSDEDVYRSKNPMRIAALELGGIRTLLGVPIIVGDESIGVIALWRQEVKAFTDDEIELVSTFADQAAIAIENVRQFQALETRTADLTKSLERQTATSEILRSISQSPTDYVPVFQTILDNAIRLCGAPFGVLYLVQDEHLHMVAHMGSNPELVDYLSSNPRSLKNLEPGGLIDRVFNGRVPVQTADISQSYVSSRGRTAARLGDVRTLLFVPMLTGNHVLGLIGLYRQEVKAFSADEIGLVRTFSDQAAIAIENVRQFQAVQERTADLTKSLERQTATSEILRAISRSPTDYEPIFETILGNAMRLCEAPLGTLFLLQDDGLKAVKTLGGTPEFLEFLNAASWPVDRNTVVGRSAVEKASIQVADISAGADVQNRNKQRTASVELEGIRTLLSVPLLKNDDVIGAITLYRREVMPFDDDQVALVGTFADQAVIAIENVRLFNETKEALEQQRASGEVLSVVSHSIADAQPVFEKIVESCERLFPGSRVGLNVIGEDGLVYMGAIGNFPGAEQFKNENFPHPASEESATGAAIKSGQVVHYPDIMGDPSVPEIARRGCEKMGLRSGIIAPLLLDGQGLGAIFAGHAVVHPFTAKEAALLKTFADQAVIAIQNARLFQALETRTTDLTQSLERQTATSEILRSISQSPTDYAPIFDTILKNAVRLCGAPFGILFLLRDDHLHVVADVGARPEYVEYLIANPHALDNPTLTTTRAAREQVPRQLTDLSAMATRSGDPMLIASMELEGIRTVCAVPMLKGAETVGVIALYRREVKSFEEDDIELVSTFADQAVIAIENVRLFQALETRNSQLGESLERQTATSDILRSISRSPTDYQPVFDTILESAARLCDAPLARLYLLRDGLLHPVADHGEGRPEFIEFMRDNPRPANQGTGAIRRALAQCKSIHVEDVKTEALYRNGDKYHIAAAELGGVRTYLTVPLIKGEDGIGVIVLYRREVRAFEDRHVGLVETFADQAVIAIENVRLFQALETRTTSLSQSLERQTATSEILRSISASPADYDPVFDTILENATRLCGAPLGVLYLLRDGHLQLVANAGSRPEFIERLRANPRSLDDPFALSSRTARAQETIQIADLIEEAQHVDDPSRLAGLELGRVRTVIGVPMLKGKKTVGVISLYRQEVKPFADEDIELVRTFADQAVIAIENVRQFQVVQERTADLTKSLERQTATSEILRSISQSPTDYAPVFDTILDSATRLCGAPTGTLFLLHDDHLHMVADSGSRPEYVEQLRSNPHPLDHPVSIISRTARARAPIHIEDFLGEADASGDAVRIATVEVGGIRTAFAVPLLKGGDAIGVIALHRRELKPFASDDIQLVSSFADQAVIAIENVRLFQALEGRTTELTKTLERQTATSEILRSISASPTDYAPVFDAILENATRLCGAPLGLLFLRRNEHLQLVADVGARTEYVEYLQANPVALNNTVAATSNAAREREPRQLTDLGAAAARSGNPLLIASLELEGIRTVCAVPMLKGAETVGVIALYRREVKAFEDDDIALVSTFADQAVIAIENVRLFQALESRNSALGESLERQTATSEILRSISRSPTDYQPVFDTILESATRLCDAPLGQLYLIRDGGVHLVAHRGGSRPEFLQFSRDNVRPANRKSGAIGTALSERRPVQIHDAGDEALYRDGDKFRMAIVELEGIRSLLTVPLLKGEESVGAMVLYRREVRPFEERHVSLVETFADQAMIAIENVRLFQALEGRTADLTKSLERQTATSEILRSISQSPTDYAPVFQTILDNAIRLCGAPFGMLFLLRDGHLHVVADVGARPEFVTYLRDNPWPVDRPSAVLSQAARERVPKQNTDQMDETYRSGDPLRAAAVELGGIRTLLGVPMLKGGETVGVIALYRQEVKTFADDDIELVTTFADQAVIAIENVRLFQALETRTADLSKTLERQTATSEILRSISQSPTGYGPVFDTILENASRLCDAQFSGLFLLRNDHLHIDASLGGDKEFVDFYLANPVPIDTPDNMSASARCARERIVQHDIDVRNSDSYRSGEKLRVAAVELGGIRTQLMVPLFRDEKTLGVLALFRQEVRAFGDDEIELVRTFADQAVIAIENVNLFNETREALERQTASADILKVISDSPTDVQPVFDAIAESARKLCGALISGVFRFDGEQIQFVAQHGWTPETLEAFQQAYPRTPAEDKLIGRALLERRVVNVADVLAEFRAPVGQVEMRYRSVLAVPLLREGVAIGAITVARGAPGLFPDQQVDLVTTFADQAVIAIENVRLFQALEGRTADLTKTLERQTATSEILRSISRSPTGYMPVFDTILKNASRLCDVRFAGLFLLRDDHLYLDASLGGSKEFVDVFRDNPIHLSTPEALSARCARERTVVHEVDLRKSDIYRTGYKLRVAAVEMGGIRTLLMVPLFRDEETLGVLSMYRQEVRAFEDEEIELVRTFADQAVIAIENVRLFQALEGRTADLTKTLERQTATSEILRSISQSPTDYAPVFQTILDSAIRLCRAPFGILFLLRNDRLRVVADAGARPEFVEHLRTNPRALTDNPEGALVRAAVEGVPCQVEDLMEGNFETADRIRVDAVEIGGVRTLLTVPMRKGDTTLGVIALYRQEVKRFADDDVELVTTFADQAVIAIENVRLFQTLEARTADLTKTLERQTATSEILRSISRSPTDYAPVFDTILDNATRLCEAPLGLLFLRRNEHLENVASIGAQPAYVEFLATFQVPMDEQTAVGQAALHKKAMQIEDTREAFLTDSSSPGRIATVKLEGARTFLAVPMLRDEQVVGVIAIYRREVRRFDDSMVELLETFADQAVIAIENVRLFQTVESRSSELAQSVAELEALGDIAQAVSSSLDVDTVLDTIVTRAVQLSRADAGAINEFDEATGTLPFRAAPGMEHMLEQPAPRLGEGAVGRAAATRAPVQIADITVPGAYTGRLTDSLEHLRIRALLAVPMMQNDNVLGALVVARRTPGEFPPEAVRLLRALGTQSAIAIRNARLFREIEDKGRELEAANRHKSEFLANMSHELRTPLNAVIGFSEVLGERMFGDLNDKQAEYVTDIHDSGRHLLSLINDILDLSKIEAGAMELDLGRFALTPALENALTLVRERAERRGINLQAQLENDLGEMEGDERKLKQILLNLLSNAIKFTPEGGSVTMEARQDDAHVHIAVRDTGVGISEEDLAVIFEEFKQVGTDYARKVEGTGLGLTLTKRFVEMHGGHITVTSEPGAGSVFAVVLPLRPAEPST